MGERLKDRVAIVTGGGRGIGAAISISFAREGAAVAVADIDIDAAKEIASRIERFGAKAIAFKTDVRNKQEVELLAKATVDNFGKIDILVNNAGILPKDGMDVVTMTDKDWDDVVTISLKGTFYCTQAVARYMVDRAKKTRTDGKKLPASKIINLGSGSGIRGDARQASYCAAKAGIMGLTKSNAKEFARYNILVNAICPCAETRLLEEAVARLPKGSREALVQRIPLGRIGDPETDIAPVALFLASDEANYITGQIIPVDGGLDMAI